MNEQKQKLGIAARMELRQINKHDTESLSDFKQGAAAMFAMTLVTFITGIILDKERFFTLSLMSLAIALTSLQRAGIQELIKKGYLKKTSNQSLDPIVKTPVDSVKVKSTLGHA